MINSRSFELCISLREFLFYQPYSIQHSVFTLHCKSQFDGFLLHLSRGERVRDGSRQLFCRQRITMQRLSTGTPLLKFFAPEQLIERMFHHLPGTAFARVPGNMAIAPPVAQRRRPSSRKSRFKVIPFINPSGARVWQVSGCKLDGTRIRENYRDENEARCRQIDLEAEFLQEPRQTSIRATKLSDDQLQLAELAVLRLGEEWGHLVDAVDQWKEKSHRVSPHSPSIHEAIQQYVG